MMKKIIESYGLNNRNEGVVKIVEDFDIQTLRDHNERLQKCLNHIKSSKESIDLHRDNIFSLFFNYSNRSEYLKNKFSENFVIDYKDMIDNILPPFRFIETMRLKDNKTLCDEMFNTYKMKLLNRKILDDEIYNECCVKFSRYLSFMSDEQMDFMIKIIDIDDNMLFNLMSDRLTIKFGLLSFIKISMLLQENGEFKNFFEKSRKLVKNKILIDF